MSRQPGADELRIRTHLRNLVDGPAVEPPSMPPGPPPDGYKPAPAADTDAWWDELYADEQPTPTARRSAPRLPDWWKSKTTITAEAEAEAEVDEPESSTGPDDLDEEPDEDTAADPKPRRRAPRQRPAFRADQQQDAPRLSLLDAYDRIPNRVRWLAYHASAAAFGWQLGWVDWGTDTAAWYAAGHWLSPSAFALYGLGACACGLYRRSRSWAWPIAWAAAVPISSVVAGIALYGTGYQP